MNSVPHDMLLNILMHIYCKHGMYSDQQNQVLLVIVFIQKAITYSYVDKIQICKHESCSIQRIEPCEKN
jgi:hypothetical protein